MCWLLKEHFQNLYPELINEYRQMEERFRNEILNVSEQFQSQLERLLSKTENPEEEPFLQERIKKAAGYFIEKNNLIFKELLDKTAVETDNKEIQKRINNTLDLFQTEVRQKQKTLEVCLTQFTVPAYLSAKSKALIEEEIPKHKKNEKTMKNGKGVACNAPTKIAVSKDILHPELYEQLRSWRFLLAQEQNLPAYVILSQMALIGITNLLPQDAAQLIRIQGVGKVTVEKYGEEILEMVGAYVRL